MLKIFLGPVSSIRESMLISHLWLPFHSRIFFLPLLPTCPSLSIAHGHIKKNKVKFSSALLFFSTHFLYLIFTALDFLMMSTVMLES